MEYPRFGGKAPSMRSIAPSVYSHHSRVTTRSSANLRSTHSMRSVVIPWYRKPILQNAILLDIQRASMITACYSVVKFDHWIVLVQIKLILNVHFLVLRALHSVHCRFRHLLFGWSCSRIHPLWLLHHFLRICLCWKHAWYYLHYFTINSFYNKQMFSVRNTLVLFSLFSMIASIALIVTSTMLIVALRKVISEFSLLFDI